MNENADNKDEEVKSVRMFLVNDNNGTQTPYVINYTGGLNGFLGVLFPAFKTWLEAHPNEQAPQPKLPTETVIESVLCFMLDELQVTYERQVKSDFGRPDVVTQSTIFEVKRTLTNHHLKHAVGQLSVYRQEFPSIHKLVVVVPEQSLSNVEPSLVRSLNVSLLGVPASPDKVTAVHLMALNSVFNPDEPGA